MNHSIQVYSAFTIFPPGLETGGELLEAVSISSERSEEVPAMGVAVGVAVGVTVEESTSASPGTFSKAGAPVSTTTGILVCLWMSWVARLLVVNILMKSWTHLTGLGGVSNPLCTLVT